MKKLMLVFIASLIVILSGCTNEINSNSDFDIKDVEGKYFYHECIYLNFLSSSTIDYQTEIYQDVLYFDYLSENLTYFGTNKIERFYEDVEFIEVDVHLDLDKVFTMGIEDLFETFEYRFDLYSGGVSIGLSMFTKGDSLFLAETRMIGGSKDLFTIWNIFEIQ